MRVGLGLRRVSWVLLLLLLPSGLDPFQHEYIVTKSSRGGPGGPGGLAWLGLGLGLGCMYIVVQEGIANPGGTQLGMLGGAPAPPQTPPFASAFGDTDGIV